MPARRGSRWNGSCGSLSSGHSRDCFPSGTAQDLRTPLPRMTPLPVFLNTIVAQCSRYTLFFMSIVLVTIMMTTFYSILAFPEAHPLVPGNACYWQTLSVFIKFWQTFWYFPPNIAYLPFLSPLSFWNCNKPYDLLHPSSKSLYSFVFIFLFPFRH